MLSSCCIKDEIRWESIYSPGVRFPSAVGKKGWEKMTQNRRCSVKNWVAPALVALGTSFHKCLATYEKSLDCLMRGAGTAKQLSFDDRSC